MVNKKNLGCKKVAWQRKATATKRSDMRMWPRLLNNNAPEMKRRSQSEAV